MALTASVGWYASDDGGTFPLASPHRKATADVRRYYMDFQALTEIQATDTIQSQTVSGGGLTVANPAINGKRIEADLSGGAVNTEYSVTFTATLSSGAVISRVGIVRVGAI